jgi:hypothetical protein
VGEVKVTRPRYDEHSTEFGLWLREQKELDSKEEGFRATNLDYIWNNYKTGLWMLLEEKRHGGAVKFPQSAMFQLIDKACHGAEGYCGLHIIRFENTSPEDGRIYLDGVEVSRRRLLDFLRRFV